ncbi:hypothetical protein BC829DRAFT_442055 [Chytridium lagenaria]|nr:hypothetical protein BC829DRAFT_442055 [Chytridium lagenaria]
MPLDPQRRYAVQTPPSVSSKHSIQPQPPNSTSRAVATLRLTPEALAAIRANPLPHNSTVPPTEIYRIDPSTGPGRGKMAFQGKVSSQIALKQTLSQAKKLQLRNGMQLEGKKKETHSTVMVDAQELEREASASAAKARKLASNSRSKTATSSLAARKTLTTSSSISKPASAPTPSAPIVSNPEAEKEFRKKLVHLIAPKPIAPAEIVKRMGKELEPQIMELLPQIAKSQSNGQYILRSQTYREVHPYQWSVYTYKDRELEADKKVVASTKRKRSDKPAAIASSSSAVKSKKPAEDDGGSPTKLTKRRRTMNSLSTSFPSPPLNPATVPTPPTASSTPTLTPTPPPAVKKRTAAKPKKRESVPAYPESLYWWTPETSPVVSALSSAAKLKLQKPSTSKTLKPVTLKTGVKADGEEVSPTSSTGSEISSSSSGKPLARKVVKNDLGKTGTPALTKSSSAMSKLSAKSSTGKVEKPPVPVKDGSPSKQAVALKPPSSAAVEKAKMYGIGRVVRKDAAATPVVARKVEKTERDGEEEGEVVEDEDRQTKLHARLQPLLRFRAAYRATPNPAPVLPGTEAWRLIASVLERVKELAS